MKQMKQGLILLCICTMMLYIAACSGNSNNASTSETSTSTPVSSTTTKPAEKVTINFAYRVDTTKTKDKLIDKFNKSQDAIEVKYIDATADTNEFRNLIVTSLAAGMSEYDVYGSDITWPAEFYQSEYALALDRMVERDNYDVSAFIPGLIDAYTYKGSLVGLPYFNNVGVLFYRTDIVKTPPTTWDELIEMGKKYVGTNGTTLAFAGEGAQYEGLVCGAMEFIGSYGGKIIDENGKVVINSPEVIKGLEKMREVWHEICPTNMSTLKNADITSLLQGGQTVFARMWPMTWAEVNNPEKSKAAGLYDIAMLPGSEKGGVGTGSLGGWGLMINAKSEHPNEAWEFMKFMLSEESQKTNAIEGGLMPTRLSLYKDADVIKSYPVIGKLYDIAAAGITRPVTPVYARISEVMQIEISKMIGGEQTAQEAVNVMEKKMNEIIAEK